MCHDDAYHAMADPCEHLEYRDAHDGQSFDHERPFCTVVDAFVQPMRADVCAARYSLDPATDCEFYRDEHDLGSVTGFESDADPAGASDNAGNDDTEADS